ncbi:MAG: DUF5011 domain-containing protein [Bacteroidetes bacterium]|nr:DUF5011 domain-containing protein [Bacteroidota bacterium]
MKQLITPSLFVLLFCHLSIAQTLPFFEGFENVGSTTTFTSSNTSINGLSEWSYEKTNQGRVRFSAGSGFYRTGAHAATLDASSSNQQSTNYLIMTLDLSSYKSSKFELSFYYMHHGEESHTADRVWIRGSSSNSWITLYDWYGNRATAGQWKRVVIKNLDTILANASQQPSATFQIRFGQADNYPAQSTTTDDGLTIDDISLIERFANDGEIKAIDRLCSGDNTITATLYNDGFDSLGSAYINWWLNGVKQSPVSYKGSIDQGQGKTITLGKATLTSGTHQLVAVVDSVNGQRDADLDDTLRVSLATGLSGNYTVGSSGDYTTLADAIVALNTLGICGPVVFTIAPGTYTGSLVIGGIVGTNKTNTITFDGQDSSKTTITHNGSSTRSTIELNQAHRIIFKNLKLATTASSTGWIVHLYNKCSYINFENCWFSMSTSGTSQDLFAIVASNSKTTETGSGANVEYLYVGNCRLEGGERSIQLMGNTSNKSSGITIVNNDFTSSYYSSLGLYDIQDLIISNNRFASFRSTGANACVFYDIDNLNFKGNNIVSRSYGVYAQDINIGFNNTSSFSNNMVTTSGVGVYFNNVRNLIVWHNSLLGNAALRFNSQLDVDVRNNLLYGLNGHAFYSASDNGYTFLDWNLYYSTSASNKAYFDGTNYNSLNAWTKDFAAFNAGSVEASPPINSQSDLHLSSSSAAEKAPYIGIDQDIDGDARCLIAVTMGADESIYPDPKPKAAFKLADSSTTNAIVLAYNNADPTDLNSYVWYADGVKVDSGSFNLEYQFSTKGRHKVTLKTVNCGSSDTISKFIVIKEPTAPAVARFDVNKTTVKVGEAVQLLNKSLNGPATIIWTISPWEDLSKNKTFSFGPGKDSSSYHNSVTFTVPGDYTICLYAKNALGSDLKCKTNVITVLDGATMCGTATGSTVSKGILRDPGGTNNYQGNSKYNCAFTIAPCVKNLRLDFTEFSLTTNRDYLRIYEGTDSKGKALHDYHTDYSNGLTGNSSSSNFKSTLYAKTGKAYFEFTTNWFFGAPGFEIEWSGTPISTSPPTADFNIPDTICVGTELAIENLSSGRGNQYFWEISSPVTNSVSYTDSAVSHFFFFNGTYEVQLIIKNCGGYDTLTKSIRVVDAKQKPKAKIHVDIEKPDINQVVTLSDISTVKGFLCSEYRTWTITPKSFAYVTGFGAQDQYTKVVFKDTGCYNIKLNVSNAAGSDEVTFTCAVRVKNTCKPKVTNLDADVGIARVVLEKIDNTTGTGLSAYTDYRTDHRTSLTSGQNYEIFIYRAKNPNSTLNRKAWIDFNQDGDFVDKLEEIASSSSPNNSLFESFIFRVPNNAIRGATTLRVGVSRANSSNTPCGTNITGEFEDYRVDITNDLEAPIITLLGDNPYSITQCGKWQDPMGYAIDNVIIDTIALSVSGKVLIKTAGSYTLTYTASDSSGNTAMAYRIVTVLADNMPPTIALQGNDTIWVEANTKYTEPGFSFTDNCTLKSGSVLNEPDTTKLGTYTLVYEAVDSTGNKAQAYRTVIVRDTKAPWILQFIGGQIIEHQINTSYTDQGITYMDNFDVVADISLNVKGSINVNTAGDYYIWYVLKDQNGNIDSAYRLVKVADYLTPIITMIGNTEDTIDVFDSYNDKGVTYVDYNGGTAGLGLVVTGSYVSEFGYKQAATKLGTYTIVYTVTNSRGGFSQKVRYITVLDREAPVISLLGDNPVEMKEKDTYMEPGWTVKDNYWGVAETWVYTYGSVQSLKPDTYYVYYYASDSSGNVSTVYSRQVIVTPIIGLGPETGQEIAIYPNPSAGQVFILGSESTPIMAYRIIGPMGQIIANKEEHIGSQRIAIDLSAYPAGSYMLELHTDTGVWHKPVLIIR